MDVHPLPAEHDGLVRYRITMPERPGRFAVLEVPADADDQVGLVELFAGSHQSLLEWVNVDDFDEGDDDEDDRVRPSTEPLSGSAPAQSPHEPPHQRHALAAG